MRLADLLKSLDRPEQRELAATSLGLLIERERVVRPGGGDGGLRTIAGPEVADLRLREDDVKTVVRRLATLIERGTVEPVVVWALAKAHDPEMIPLLRRLLVQFSTSRDEGGQAVAMNAFTGLLGVDMRDDFKKFVESISERAVGEVRDSLVSWLKD